MTVAVVTVAVGDKYRQFLPAWLQAVSQLQTTPEQVVVVTDDVASIRGLQRDTLDFLAIKGASTWQHHPQFLANEAVALCETDWVCKMDVDDLIYPHALNALQDCDADVFMFGINVTEEGKPAKCLPAFNVTAQDVLNIFDNRVFSGSPYRKWLWEENNYRDMIYEDWAFWIEAAKSNAVFHRSMSIDYEYRLHGDNISSKADDLLWRQVVRDIWT